MKKEAEKKKNKQLVYEIDLNTSSTFVRFDQQKCGV
jgi:hypothetical protein